MDDKGIKEKAVFVVGLLAAFLAFSGFKDKLSQIYLSIADHPYSLWGMMVVFIVLLTISVYLYALDYLKYSFGKHQNFILFKFIIPLANFFYSSAILFPLFVLLFWIIGSDPIYSFLKQYKGAVASFDIVAITLAVISGVTSAYFQGRRAKEATLEIMENQKTTYLHRAVELYNNKFYSESLMETSKTIEQYLKEKLFEKRGFTTRYVPFAQLVDIALEKQILSTKEIRLLKRLKFLRNMAAHSTDKISKERAEFGLNFARTILEKE